MAKAAANAGPVFRYEGRAVSDAQRESIAAASSSPVEPDPACQASLLLSALTGPSRVLEICTAGNSRLLAASAGFLPGKWTICTLPAAGNVCVEPNAALRARDVTQTPWRDLASSGSVAREKFDVIVLTGLCNLVAGDRPNVADVLRVAEQCLAPSGAVTWSENNRWAFPFGLVKSPARQGWSLHAMRRLLRDAGLAPRRADALIPGLHRPAYVLPFDAPGVSPALVDRVMRTQFVPLNRAGLDQRIKGVLATAARSRWARQFSPAWQVAATGAGPADPSPLSLVDQIAADCLGPDVRAAALLVRRTHCAVVPMGDSAGRLLAYAKLPLSHVGQKALAAHRAMLQRLPELAPAGVPTPRVVADGQHQGQPFHIETALSGTGGGRMQAPLELLVERAMLTLIALHTATRHPGTQPAAARWRQRLEVLTQHTLLHGVSNWPQFAARANVELEKLPCVVLAHHDYHLGNVIYSDAREVSGVLDWDLADEADLPVCDALHLALSSVMRRRLQPRGTALLGLVQGDYPAELRAVQQYMAALGIANDLRPWQTLYALTHVRRLTAQAEFTVAGSPERETIGRHIREIVDDAVA